MRVRRPVKHVDYYSPRVLVAPATAEQMFEAVMATTQTPTSTAQLQRQHDSESVTTSNGPRGLTRGIFLFYEAVSSNPSQGRRAAPKPEDKHYRCYHPDSKGVYKTFTITKLMRGNVNGQSASLR